MISGHSSVFLISSFVCQVLVFLWSYSQSPRIAQASHVDGHAAFYVSDVDLTSKAY